MTQYSTQNEALQVAETHNPDPDLWSAYARPCDGGFVAAYAPYQMSAWKLEKHDYGWLLYSSPLEDSNGPVRYVSFRWSTYEGVLSGMRNHIDALGRQPLPGDEVPARAV